MLGFSSSLFVGYRSMASFAEGSQKALHWILNFSLHTHKGTLQVVEFFFGGGQLACDWDVSYQNFGLIGAKTETLKCWTEWKIPMGYPTTLLHVTFDKWWGKLWGKVETSPNDAIWWLAFSSLRDYCLKKSFVEQLCLSMLQYMFDVMDVLFISISTGWPDCYFCSSTLGTSRVWTRPWNWMAVERLGCPAKTIKRVESQNG